MVHKPRLPVPVEHKLQAIRSLLRQYIAAQAALFVVGWLLLLFWLGGMLDYLPVRAGSNESPTWVRTGLLLAMGLGCLWIIGRWALPRWLTPLPDRSLALLIERHHPKLNNELVTTVELNSTDQADVSNPEVHADMLERVRNSVARRITGVDPAGLFNWQPLWASGTAVVFGLLITLITAIAMPAWLGLWAQRLFALSDATWPRAAELRADGIQLQFPTFTGQLSADRVMLPFDEAGVVHLPAGATALLQISANAAAKKVPEVCTLFYRSADGTRGRANLRRVGSPREGWQQFTLDGSPLDGISENLALDVIGLDARLRDLQLQVVEPAVVSELKLVLRYPRYLLDSLSSRPAEETLTYRAGLRIPQGTELTIIGQANSQLSQVEYVIRDAATASGGNASSANATNLASAAETNALNIRTVTPQGNQFRLELGDIRNTQVLELRLIDEYKLSSDQILRYVITVLEDTPPEVESTLAGIGTAITSNALLPIRGKVTDDNGIAEVSVELAVNESEPLLFPVAVTDSGELQTDIDLEKLATEQAFPIQANTTLGIVVTARDHFNLNEQQHIGRGQPQQLAVVTPDQLLVLLDRQELELRQRLELIIIELQQVNEVLEQLGNSFDRVGEAAQFGRAMKRAISMVAFQDPATQPANPTGDSVAEQGEQDTAGETAEQAAERRAQQRRMAVLRAQQSQLQCDKSEQELTGVAKRVENLRLQLLNNRIDSYDRQNRLATKVHAPLVELLEGDYRKLNRSLAELQTAAMSEQGFDQTQAALAALSRVLDALELVKSNMLDIESFNEIVDLVRTLLEDQESLLNETEEQQKARIFDFLK